MNKKSFFISHNSFLKLLNNLSHSFEIITPQGDENYFFEHFQENFVFNKYRAITSLRQFLVPPIEYINGYFEPFSFHRKPFCIVGAKNCDLNSLKTQDFVFLEGEEDRHYKFMRNNNLIISSDCTFFKNVCFCLSLNLLPYPTELFDLNLSQLEDGYLVEIGSSRGKKVIEENKSLFEESKRTYLESKEQKRKEIVENLTMYLKTAELPLPDTFYSLIKKGYENRVWEEEAVKCVECGACIVNCPTCHCFLLFDTESEKGYIRARTWDGCQYKNFARVAGGANPLKFRELRLRNRYIKKFEFFPQKCGLYACTGCGRCIESCPAKIDLREIFKKLSKN
jgi:ferredoxin